METKESQEFKLGAGLSQDMSKLAEILGVSEDAKREINKITQAGADALRLEVTSGWGKKKVMEIFKCFITAQKEAEEAFDKSLGSASGKGQVTEEKLREQIYLSGFMASIYKFLMKTRQLAIGNGPVRIVTEDKRMIETPADIYYISKIIGCERIRAQWEEELTSMMAEQDQPDSEGIASEVRDTILKVA